MKLEPVIGLEIHVQLKTASKMFCACDNTGELQAPNTTICPICTGHPGTLPAPNAEAIHMAVKAALALNLHINFHSKFDRKNYFYPDLPKGYQISQYDEPLAQEGYLTIQGKNDSFEVGIERLHLEEDTGKSFHVGGKTFIDFNRSGTPLIEIVTKPDIKIPEAAKAFLQELRLILRYLDVSDADMEKGHLRCDANISMRPQGDNTLYAKTEIKNLNSFRAVEKALHYEIVRQTELWEKDEVPSNTSTRGWDEKRGETVLQREKEAEHDYRYFPEPDIPPLELKQTQIDIWHAELPELPQIRRRGLIEEYGLNWADAKLLTDDVSLGNYILDLATALAPEMEGDTKAAIKLTVSWIVHKLSAILTEKNLALANVAITQEQWIGFLLLVARHQVNSTNAQVLLRRMVETGKDPETILESEDLRQGAGENLFELVEKVFMAHPQQAAELKTGKVALLKYFVGLLMKETKGKVNPQELEKIIQQKL